MKEIEMLRKSQVHALKEKEVRQHNAITSGSYDLTPCQIDIMFMILASLKPNELNYKIHIKDIETITGRKWNYKQLRKSTKDLGSSMFEIIPNDEKVDLRQLWLFQKVDFHVGEGTFEVMISEPARPYFFDLKNSYTSVQLKSILDCSSRYAKRLYTLARQWRTTGHKSYSIIELKTILGLIDAKGKEQHERISDFRTYVLDIAKEQINEHTDMEFDYRLHKRGRSFKTVEFFINIKVDLQLEIDFQKPIAEQRDIKTIMAYGLSNGQAVQILEKETIKEFEKMIGKLKEKVSKGELKIDNSVGYIVGVYKNKGIIH